MKKVLHRIMLTSIFTISTHQIHAYSLQDFTSDVNRGWFKVNEWFATNVTAPFRSWWYKTPGTQEATLIAAREALSKEQASKKIALNNAIDQFFTKLTSFKTTLQSIRFENIQYIWTDDQDFLQELDSIKDFGMPKSIYDAAKAVNKPELIESLRKVFEFLQPTITWNDLSNENKNKLLTMQVPPETNKNLSTYLATLTKSDPFKTDRFVSTYFKWLQGEGKNTGKLIPSHVKPNDKIILSGYLPFLRNYKKANVLEKLQNSDALLTALDTIKKQT